MVLCRASDLPLRSDDSSLALGSLPWWIASLGEGTALGGSPLFCIDLRIGRLEFLMFGPCFFIQRFRETMEKGNPNPSILGGIPADGWAHAHRAPGGLLVATIHPMMSTTPQAAEPHGRAGEMPLSR